MNYFVFNQFFMIALILTAILGNVANAGFWTGWYGGMGGGQHEISGTGDIHEICVRHGRFIDSIQVRYSSSGWSPEYGGDGAGKSCWSPESGTCITSVSLRAGRYVDSLQWITSNGRTSPDYGSHGGSENSADGNGLCLTRIGVYSGNFVDGIRFYFD